nr:MFS transporter [Catenovulum maritimum]
MTSLIAISVDVLLPAYADIRLVFSLSADGSIENIILYFFIGLSLGYPLAGMSADILGRETTIAAGLILFVLGSVIAANATNFDTLLYGRLIQGFGAAGPRVASLALIRDRFSGAAMAKIMSLLFAIFILIPIGAPFIGAFILALADWSYIFYFNALIAVFCLIWLGIKSCCEPPASGVSKQNFAQFCATSKRLFSNYAFLLLCIISGLIFAGFFLYLSFVPELLTGFYAVSNLPLYLAACGFSMGLAAIFNKWLVSVFRLQSIVIVSCILLVLIAAIAHFVDFSRLIYFVVFLNLVLFFIGIMFSNINTLVLTPVEQGRGWASAIWGLVSNAVGALSVYVASLFYTGTSGDIFDSIGCFMLLALLLLGVNQGLSLSAKAKAQ